MILKYCKSFLLLALIIILGVTCSHVAEGRYYGRGGRYYGGYRGGWGYRGGFGWGGYPYGGYPYGYGNPYPALGINIGGGSSSRSRERAYERGYEDAKQQDLKAERARLLEENEQLRMQKTK